MHERVNDSGFRGGQSAGRGQNTGEVQTSGLGGQEVQSSGGGSEIWRRSVIRCIGGGQVTEGVGAWQVRSENPVISRSA